jgi:mitochondrial fission protein ELM1
LTEQIQVVSWRDEAGAFHQFETTTNPTIPNYDVVVTPENTSFNSLVTNARVTILTAELKSKIIPTNPVTNTITRDRLNPTFDASKVYVPRSQRPEWVIVGLLGQIPVKPQ